MGYGGVGWAGRKNQGRTSDMNDMTPVPAGLARAGEERTHIGIGRVDVGTVGTAVGMAWRVHLHPPA